MTAGRDTAAPSQVTVFGRSDWPRVDPPRSWRTCASPDGTGFEMSFTEVMVETRD